MYFYAFMYKSLQIWLALTNVNLKKEVTSLEGKKEK